ncbi:hypothetical protein [Moraxella sp. Pampa]|uniref:hypothetical protein n=1 Tax=Moraxella sp. Pampa TaxID=3111978 RepID=UPI002B40C2C2|nr:hypothetical protein [Moraxella sp. Pampa]
MHIKTKFKSLASRRKLTITNIALATMLVVATTACSAEDKNGQLKNNTAITQENLNANTIRDYSTILYHADNLKKTKYNLLKFYTTNPISYISDDERVELMSPERRNINIVLFDLKNYPVAYAHADEHEKNQYFALNIGSQTSAKINQLSAEQFIALDKHFFSPCFVDNITDEHVPKYNMGLNLYHYGDISKDAMREYLSYPAEPNEFVPQEAPDVAIVAGTLNQKENDFTFENRHFQTFYQQQCSNSEAKNKLSKRFDMLSKDGHLSLDEFYELDEQRAKDMVEIKQAFQEYAKKPAPRPMFPAKTK